MQPPQPSWPRILDAVCAPLGRSYPDVQSDAREANQTDRRGDAAPFSSRIFARGRQPRAPRSRRASRWPIGCAQKDLGAAATRARGARCGSRIPAPPSDFPSAIRFESEIYADRGQTPQAWAAERTTRAMVRGQRAIFFALISSPSKQDTPFARRCISGRKSLVRPRRRQTARPRPLIILMTRKHNKANLRRAGGLPPAYEGFPNHAGGPGPADARHQPPVLLARPHRRILPAIGGPRAPTADFEVGGAGGRHAIAPEKSRPLELSWLIRGGRKFARAGRRELGRRSPSGPEPNWADECYLLAPWDCGLPAPRASIRLRYSPPCRSVCASKSPPAAIAALRPGQVRVALETTAKRHVWRP